MRELRSSPSTIAYPWARATPNGPGAVFKDLNGVLRDVGGLDYPLGREYMGRLLRRSWNLLDSSSISGLRLWFTHHLLLCGPLKSPLDSCCRSVLDLRRAGFLRCRHGNHSAQGQLRVESSLISRLAKSRFSSFLEPSPQLSSQSGRCVAADKPYCSRGGLRVHVYPFSPLLGGIGQPEDPRAAA